MALLACSALLADASDVGWLSGCAASATVAATAPSNSMRGSRDMIMGETGEVALEGARFAVRDFCLFHHMLLTRDRTLRLIKPRSTDRSV
ncbi:hypothetical protein KPSA1_05933 [Pseudomonas syringae pv. actinidiae]|uniref:Uncharacterized protein n=1 Tax=Pseudomonas syringae pv. actinidiae TaxID=103796 RepID=A0A2V0QQE3_PSESF|nr:hypothetical protein KPSA1_05933 [Pseudomonas syringae pv. actinidiae]